MVKLATLGPGWPLIVLSDAHAVVGHSPLHTCDSCTVGNAWCIHAHALGQLNAMWLQISIFLHAWEQNFMHGLHQWTRPHYSCNTKHAFIHAHAATYHTTPACILELHTMHYACCTVCSASFAAPLSRWPTNCELIWWHQLRCSFDVWMNSDLRNPLSLLHPPRFELEVLRK